MAMKLDKPIVVESTTLVNKQNVMVCLQTDQTIRLKLKSADSKVLTISVEDLYKFLQTKDNPIPIKKVEVTPSVPETKINKSNLEVRDCNDNEPLFNMQDFRSAYMILPIPYDVKVKLEAKTSELLGLYKRKKSDKTESTEKNSVQVGVSASESTTTEKKKRKKS
jgi:hypothetical protein